MRGRVVVTDEVGGRSLAALIVDGVVEDLLIDPRPGDPGPRTGAVYCARVIRPAPTLGGAFVDLGGAEGLVREAGPLKPGAHVLAQVTGQPEPGKAVPMTARVLYKGRYAILTPGAPGLNIARRIRDGSERMRLTGIAEAALPDAAETGLILRSASAGVEAAVIAEDIADLVAQRAEAEAAAPGLALSAPSAAFEAWRDWVDPEPDAVYQDEAGRGGHAEQFGVWATLDRLATPEAVLAGGGFMAIERTRACVTVDVNTGGDFSPAAGLKATLAALRALPRELRLRGLGGVVVIDPAALAKKDRPQVEAVLKAAFKADSIETSVAGWTPLGHLELQRKRERRPLAELWP